MRPIDYFLRSVKKSPDRVFLDDGVTKHTYLDAEKKNSPIVEQSLRFRFYCRRFCGSLFSK